MLIIALGVLGLSVVGVLLNRAASPASAAARRKWASGTGLPTPRLRLVREPTVSVVIPSLNEEASLPWVLENLPPFVTELILVDGLSTDRTENLARSLRPDIVVVHQLRRGKGAALRAGFAAATGDIVVMIDADGSTDPREMYRFVDALKDGADFVKGSRHLAGGGSTDLTPVRRLGNQGFVALANMLYGSRFTDLLYGYCAFWRRHVSALALTGDGFEIETQLVLNALKAGLEIREVPSWELPRRAGTSNLHAARDGLRCLRTMLGRGDMRPNHSAVEFMLQKMHVPVFSSGELPPEGERRRTDRRRLTAEESGYVGPDRRRAERRKTVGTVAVYRAVYSPPEPVPARNPALDAA